MIGRSIMTGISAGVTVGALAFEISRKTQRSKRRLKSRAGKALKNMSSFIDELSDIMR